MNQDEKTLVNALQQGDQYACNDLVERYSGKIYNVALRLTGHPMEAEEVLQETFINACQGVENFEQRSSLGTWLYRIATNNGLMRLRRRKKPTVPLNGSPDQEEGHFWPRHLEDWEWEPESLTLNDELQHVMDDAVAALPETLQAAFILRDLEGFSTKQTAEILDISPNNVKVRLHRARLMLREQLAAYFDEKTNGTGDTP
jgi:RNA polymerase sigma-70 factor (ECF subfamily)